MRHKVTVVGAGNVGATCAQELARRDYADVVLVDIKEGLPQGKALDIDQAAAVLGYEASVSGSNGYEETAGSEVVVITAGLPRQPGMSRDDLVTTNEKIVGSVTEQVASASPAAIVVVVSNPLDAMCHVAKNVSGWPKERVFGMAGILDTARFSTFIAWETGMSIKDVTAMVLGGHGDQMVPVVSATTVGGIPLRKLVAEDQIQAMVERTAKGGGELVNLLGTSAWYAPGAAARADGGRNRPRREARPPVHGLPRRGVRHRRPLHGRAGRARIEGDRTRRRARPRRRRAAGAEGLRGRGPRGRLGPHHLSTMELGLRGRTAIVCGGSAGIGLGCAEALAEAGANLVLFARGREGVEREAARLGALPVAGDVRSPDDLARLVDAAVERFGGLDVLVLNSGGPPRTGSFEFSDEQLEDAVALLLLSSIRLVRLCLPYLEASGRGRVIAITSSAVKEPIDTLALSSAVRPGLVGWLKTASRELGPKGITVNSVAPGRIDTERIREVYPDGPSEADLATIPLRRLGAPREIGDVVCFLASDRASYVTGAAIGVDGGLTRGTQ